MHKLKFSSLKVFFISVVFFSSCQVNQPEATLKPVIDITPSATAAVNAEANSSLPSPSLPDKILSGCTVVSPKPTPGATQQSLFPPITQSDWIKGADEGNVQILEYGDFQCPNCAMLAPILDQLIEKYPYEVSIVYRHYPVMTIHNKATLAAQAAEAAGIQGHFWEMHDLLFNHQSEWETLSVDDFEAWLIKTVDEINLDPQKFSNDIHDNKISQKITEAWENNINIGIPYTPFLLFNNQIWPDALPVNILSLVEITEISLLERRQYSSCPPLTINLSSHYEAIIHTEHGVIHIELYADLAPLAVNNFIFLAKNGWYDGVTFHRVIPGFVAQAGDPSGTGYGGPGYAFINEQSNMKFNQPGLVAMANSGMDTNGSQFFITFASAPHLNGKFTIFGEVISGMDVVQKLTPRDPGQQTILQPGDKILSVDIIED